MTNPAEGVSKQGAPDPELVDENLAKLEEMFPGADPQDLKLAAGIAAREFPKDPAPDDALKAALDKRLQHKGAPTLGAVVAADGTAKVFSAGEGAAAMEAMQSDSDPRNFSGEVGNR